LDGRSGGNTPSIAANIVQAGDRFVSGRQAAAILGVTKATIGRWAAKGAFNRYGSSRKAAYLVSELVRFMASGIGVTGEKVFRDHNPAVNLHREGTEICPACGPGDHGAEAHPEPEEFGDAPQRESLDPAVPAEPVASAPMHVGPVEAAVPEPDPDSLIAEYEAKYGKL
jgi:hypothetical protein